MQTGSNNAEIEQYSTPKITTKQRSNLFIPTIKTEINLEAIEDEFVVFDLETTGLINSRIPVDIVEISAIKFIKSKYIAGEPLETFSFLLKPHRGKINPDVERINGISEDMVFLHGRETSNVIPEFIDFVGNRKLIAYNVDFDRWFLQRELRDLNIYKKIKFECALKLSRSTFFGLPNYKLTTVATALNIESFGAHRAMRDVEMTLEIYLKAKSAIKNSVHDQVILSSLKPNPKGLFFGKRIFVSGIALFTAIERVITLLADAGFELMDSLDESIDYFVFVNEDTSNLILKKAREYQLNGHRISIHSCFSFFGLFEGLRLTDGSLIPYSTNLVEKNGKVIVFTGNMTRLRDELVLLAERAGYKVSNSVTRKTDFLVLGDTSIHGDTGKKTKAESVIAQGGKLKIIDEETFYSLVKSTTS